MEEKQENLTQDSCVLGVIGTAHHTRLVQYCYANMLSHKLIMLYVSQHFGPTENNISFGNLKYNHDCQVTNEGFRS